MHQRLINALNALTTVMASLVEQSAHVIHSVKSVAFYRVNYSRVAETLQAPCLIFIFYSIAILPLAPSVGIAVAILGLATGAMAARAIVPERISLTEQVTWIVIITLLCGVELYAIRKMDADLDKERDESRAQDATTRAAERRSFQHLFDSAKGLLSQEQQTSRLAEQNLENITGARSYAWITPQVSDISTKSIVPLTIHNYGNHTLTGVEVRILDLEVFNISPFDLARVMEQMYRGPKVKVGTLSGGDTRTLPQTIGPIHFGTSGTHPYSIGISAQNGVVEETLVLRSDKHHADQLAYSISAYVRGRPLPNGKFTKSVPLEDSGWSDEGFKTAHHHHAKLSSR